MWNKEKLKRYGFDNSSLGKIAHKNLRFIPKISDLLDLLDDPMKIPRLYTPFIENFEKFSNSYDNLEPEIKRKPIYSRFPAEEYSIEIFKPKSKEDELRVRRFKGGLIEVAEISEKLIKGDVHEAVQEKKGANINIFFENLGERSGGNIGEKFLGLSIGYQGQIYGLQFFVGDKNASYNVRDEKNESEFAEIMERNIDLS